MLLHDGALERVKEQRRMERQTSFSGNCFVEQQVILHNLDNEANDTAHLMCLYCKFLGRLFVFD